MMTTKLEQAARQALEALESCNVGNWSMAFDEFAVVEAITALREALAEQAEQEPNYFGLTHDHTWLSIDKKQYDKLKPEGRMTCYAAPVRTKDLTDDEILACGGMDGADDWAFEFARAVIAADRAKNNLCERTK